MNIEKGDNVRFLNDVGGGVVTRIIDNNTVTVLIEEGFEVPAKINQLVVIKNEKSEKKDKQEIIIEHEEEIISSYNYIEREDIFFNENNLIPDEDNDTSLFFGFVPVKNNNITDCDLNAYLINDSNYEVLYNISTKQDDLFVNIDSGIIEANTKSLITRYKRENINELSTFLFQFIFYKNGYYEPLSPFSKDIKINPTKFYKESNFEDNLFFENKAVIFPVFKDDLKKEIEKLTNEELKEIIKEKEILKPQLNILSQNYKKSKEIPVVEVDLHIEQLIDDFRNLSNGEIVIIQMNNFHKELELAISNKTKKIIFIHGVGSGVLKSEIRKSLDKSYPHLKYQDASFKEYGYGATMVILRN